jgi:hypothetical protein
LVDLGTNTVDFLLLERKQGTAWRRLTTQGSGQIAGLCRPPERPWQDEPNQLVEIQLCGDYAGDVRDARFFGPLPQTAAALGPELVDRSAEVSGYLPRPCVAMRNEQQVLRLPGCQTEGDPHIRKNWRVLCETPTSDALKQHLPQRFSIQPRHLPAPDLPAVARPAEARADPGPGRSEPVTALHL